MRTPDADWFLAEELLTRQYDWFEVSIHEMPLFAFGVEKPTR
jgi:hypothetical protein